MTRALPFLLLSFFLSLPLEAASRLSLGLAYSSGAAPGKTFEFEPSIVNDGPDPARNVVLTVQIPPETTVASITPLRPGWTCDVQSDNVVCTTPSLPVAFGQIINIRFQAPAQSNGGTHPIRVLLTDDDTPPTSPHSILVHVTVWRTIAVTSGAGTGPGSLRQTILDANPQCVDVKTPCWVMFDLQRPATILLSDPLPVVTACSIHFEGNDLTLDGSLLRSGNGFEFNSCGSPRLAGITIQRFPESGILVRRGHLHVERSTISNNFRGITLADPDAQVQFRGNTIRDNARSGIFSLASRYLLVTESRILDNGASGIFVARGALSVGGGEISGHPQFGIALQPGVYASVSGSIHSNVEAAIDYGLDRRTPNDTPDRDGVPNAPELTDAFYDAATNTTIVRGIHRGGPYESHRVVVYANHFDAELERFAGLTHVISGTAFEARISGDLRGQLITAVSQSIQFPDLMDWATSEVSEGISVR